MQVSPQLEKYYWAVMSAHIKCFSSLCSVLDLNAFERQNKAEGLGMVSEEGTSKSLGHYNIINYSSSAFSPTFEGSDYTGTYFRMLLLLFIHHKNKVFLFLKDVIL